MKIDINKKYDILNSGGEEQKIKLSEILGDNKTILYFYPKDNTPGCTLENKDFTCLKTKFEEKGYKVIGVSKDSIESHKRFVQKQGLNIDLISDSELILHKELLTFGEKNNYGKIVMGVIRSTFIINFDGEVIIEYRNIRAKGHAERILKELV